MVNGTAGMHSATAPLPPWLNAEDLVDRVTCEELRQLTAWAEALEPTIRALCVRSFHASRRYDAQVRDDLPPVSLPRVLHGALSVLQSHLEGATGSIAGTPDWREAL